MDDDGKLRVLQLTDLHLTAPAWNGNDRQTLEWVKTAIRLADPDVVAVTGDAAMGIYWYRQREKGIVAIAEIFEEAGIPWMYTLGNHDGEWSWDTQALVGQENEEQGNEELLEILQGYKYSLMQKGDTTGTGNYVIDVVDKDGNVVYGLINMDTHGKVFNEDGSRGPGYMGLSADQVQWYEREVNALCERAGKLIGRFRLAGFFQKCADFNKARQLFHCLRRILVPAILDFLRFQIFQRRLEFPFFHKPVDVLHDGVVALDGLQLRKKHAGFFYGAEPFNFHESQFVVSVRGGFVYFKEKFRMRFGRGGEFIVRAGDQKQGCQSRGKKKTVSGSPPVPFLKNHCSLFCPEKL